MMPFIVVYGIALLIAAAFVARSPDFFGNVGFLVIGALISIYPVFLMDEFKRRREAKNIANALFNELADRVARCCFDFEAPWSTLLKRPTEMEVFRLLKFSPEPPVIYPSAVESIGLLKGDALQALIKFYSFLAAWDRDIANTAAEYRASPGATLVMRAQVQLLARRLQQTLLPGIIALEKLAPDVPNAEKLELASIEQADKYFPDAHPNAGKPLRQRIVLALGDEGNKQA